MDLYVLKQIRNNQKKSFQTLAFMLTFVGIGLCESALGPSLLDFEVAVSVSTTDIAWVITASMVGFVGGSIVIGFAMYPYLNPFLCNFFCLLFSAMATAWIPYNRTLVGLIISVLVNGFAVGIIDAIGNLTVLLMWGADEVFMQLLHFGFGLGAVFAPLIVSPFLLLHEADVQFRYKEDVQFRNTSRSAALKNYTSENLKFQTAYLIFAIYMVCIAALFLYLFLRHRHILEHPSRMVSSKSDLNSPRLNKTIFEIVVCLATVFMHIYYGVEIAIGSFLTVFAYYSDLNLSKAIGASITSVFWGAICIFQLIAVFYMNKIGPEKNIIIELTIVMLANCILIPFGNTQVWSLWAGTAVMGIGMSAIWATIFGYFENYFPVTNKIASGFTISACLGELVVPYLMGTFIETVPKVFLWIILSNSIAICVLFIVINTLCKNHLIVKSSTRIKT